ncbi:MAG: pilin [Patescibacteria group bacterium]
MNAVKSLAYSSVAALTLAQTTFAAGINAGVEKVDERLKGRSDNLETGIQSMISFVTNLLYLIAVGFVLYGGFLMLTAGGDDEKVKSGKKILMQAALGLLVIFIASSLVSFILRLIQA